MLPLSDKTQTFLIENIWMATDPHEETFEKANLYKKKGRLGQGSVHILHNQVLPNFESPHAYSLPCPSPHLLPPKRMM